VIVGGGLAGCAAAITTLQVAPQTRVLVVERGLYPRHKVCGEFVSAEGLAALRQLLDASRISSLIQAPPITQANICVDGRVLSAPIAPAAVSIARLDLDLALWQRARDLGADCREKVSVSRVSGSGPFEILTSGDPVESAALVNAAGRWSVFNQTDLAPFRHAQSNRWIGLKAHFAEAVSQPTIDLYLFDGGYCGVQQVASGRVNVCAMVHANRATTLSEVFALHPELMQRTRRWRPQMETITTAPLNFREPLPVGNGMIHVGDAAGFIDPFVGDGMTLALRSGILAGETLAAVARRECDLRAAAENYRQSYDLKLLPAFRRARWIRKMLHLPLLVRIPLAGLIRMTGATESLLRATRIAG